MGCRQKSCETVVSWYKDQVGNWEEEVVEGWSGHGNPCQM